MLDKKRTVLLTTIFILLVFIGCNQNDFRPMAEYSGYTQGSTYHIVCDSTNSALDKQLETLLKNLDHSISTWDSLSLVSQFNRSENGISVDDYFIEVLNISKKIHAETDGAFNPAIYPITQNNRNKDIDSTSKKPIPADSLLRYTRFGDIFQNKNVSDSLGKSSKFITKKYAKNGLDFSGIAKGYTVDVICKFLDSRRIENYFVQIGSSSKSKGTNWHKKPWGTSIDKPTISGEIRIVQAIIPLQENALSAAGNYQDFYEMEGKRYNTFIDPSTGKMTQNTLLSTQVFAPSAAEADAYSNAFMVMGAGKTTQFLTKRRELSAYLISSGFDEDFQTWMSPSLEKLIEESK